MEKIETEKLTSEEKRLLENAWPSTITSVGEKIIGVVYIDNYRRAVFFTDASGFRMVKETGQPCRRAYRQWSTIGQWKRRAGKNVVAAVTTGWKKYRLQYREEKGIGEEMKMNRAEQVKKHNKNVKEAFEAAGKGETINLTALMGGHEEIVADDINKSKNRGCYSDNWKVKKCLK